MKNGAVATIWDWRGRCEAYIQKTRGEKESVFDSSQWVPYSTIVQYLGIELDDRMSFKRPAQQIKCRNNKVVDCSKERFFSELYLIA